jgi:GTP-binding protein LepA
MEHFTKGGDRYILNLIDTPGHVDFGYEVSNSPSFTVSPQCVHRIVYSPQVSRSLAACEGALLVVDATQGVQAQTIANAYLALDRNMTIIPVINKIDISSADPERTAREIEDTIGIPCTDALLVSAKTGKGVEDLLDAIALRLPPPHSVNKHPEQEPFRALIFDACYDKFKGVVVYFRVMEGKVRLI